MSVSDYLKQQLRADASLQSLTEDECYAIVEALTLVPQVRPDRTRGTVPLDFRVLSQGKPKQRIGGPWASGADLNDWGTLSLEQHTMVAHKWRDYAAEVAPRIPAMAMPMLARCMAYAAAFDPKTPRGGDPLDIGFVKDMVVEMARLAGAGDISSEIRAGADARARVFDWGYARQRLDEMPDAQDESSITSGVFHQEVLAALGRLGIAVPTELAIEDAALHHLDLRYTSTSEVAIRVTPHAVMSETLRAAFRALDGMEFAPFEGGHDLDDAGWAHWRVIEGAPGDDGVYALLASGATLGAKDCSRVFGRRIGSVSVMALHDS